MSADETTGGRQAVLVGYDGSPGAAGAIEIGARLLPDAAPRIATLWLPPFSADAVKARLWRRAGSLDELARLVEEQGAAAAERTAGEGVALAAAAGWRDAEPLTQRSYGSQGFELAHLAGELGVAALVLGSRGLSGVRAALGSVSDFAVHYSSVPVLVVPHPLLEEDRRAAEAGPVVVGHDGSEGAERALWTARDLFGEREIVVASAGRAGEPPATPGAVALEAVGVPESGRAVADALALFAAERGAAAIVVGSRGRSAAREMLLGSVAMATLHHTHRPVLVVPDPSRFKR